MAYRFIFTLFLLSFTSCAVEGTAITVEELEKHVYWLAADEQEGREAGTEGEARAAAYLVEHLIDAGLQPAGEDGSYYQYFDIAGDPIEGESSLAIEGSQINVRTLAASSNRPVRGELSLDLENVSGKIILLKVDDINSVRTTVRDLSDQGAKGVIVFPSFNDWSFGDVPGRLPLSVVVVESLEHPSLFDNVKEGDLVEMHADVVQKTKKACNVLALAPGSSDELITVGAHFDHLGWGGSGSLAPGVHAIHNGADDNASGTAVVLEIAEEYGARESAPDRGVLFCFWGAEEKGLLGSDYWVENPTVPLENVLLNINLDMIGRLEDSSMIVGSAFTADCFDPAIDSMREYFVEQGEPFKLEVMEGALPGGGGSDHMSFHKKSIPAVFFFSGLHSDYHKPSDDPEKITYPEMAYFAHGLMPFMQTLEVAEAGFAYKKPEPEEERSVASFKVWFGSIPDYGAEPEDGGMAISGTSPGSPAEKLGLIDGDIIKQVGKVTIFDIYDFMDALALFKNGDIVLVKWLRDGKEMDGFLTFFPRGGKAPSNPH